MADIYVRNSLSTDLTVKFNMTLRYFIIKGEEGEHFWTLEIGTTHSGIAGADISSKKVHKIAASNLDRVIEENLALLAAQIDWNPLVRDTDPPYVINFSPQGDDVEIGTIVRFILEDQLPSAGIDVSSISVYFDNGYAEFDVTNDIKVSGDPYEYTVEWEPDDRIYKRYFS